MIAPTPLMLGLLPPLAKGDFDAIVAIIWVAFMVIGGLVNYLKKRADDAKQREEEARRAGKAFEPTPRSYEPAEAQEGRGHQEEVELEPIDDDDDDAERRRAQPARGAAIGRPAQLHESFDEYARRKRAEREAAEQQEQEALERAQRLAEEDRRRAIRERDAAAAEAAYRTSVAPVVTAIAPPASAAEAAAMNAARARGEVVHADPCLGPILPLEVSARLTEAQRLFLGGEIFARPKMLRPGPRRPRRKPGAPAEAKK